ncbi:hypothetical protein HHK36_001760 [Tetracentron sinense]|uniref:LPPG:FO 2-phospho-L-lactate transferase CofD/UPF0052 n=1 Tax=Tetracentron sinense TaxID=13715 RepID=A0A835A4A0_TETSI|nr:hypothetical protein HHK36_001760 [Tetracentron sinense]
MADGCLGPALCKALQFSIPFRFKASSRSLSMATQRSTSLLAHSSSNPSQPSLLVFSGGTAFNGVVEELKNLTTRVAHVLPVSDDGGSTAEIVRVLGRKCIPSIEGERKGKIHQSYIRITASRYETALDTPPLEMELALLIASLGGPAVGDIRSRCLRLSDESTSEALAVRRLLGHRLPLDALQAKSEWYDIVEGEHSLWRDVSRPYGETIRAFLVYFQNQILRRSSESFSFSNGSIGNFFFAGARIFFQSLDAAIFLFSRVSDIPTESLVLPVISTNDRLTLGCELWDGTIIRGQNEISHPTNGSMEPINKVFPTANPTVLDQLSKVDCIVYAMGSVFTSVCPSLVLLGIGEIISSRTYPKVLLLNGSHDRETSGFTASCFVTAITDALNRTYGDPQNCLKNLPNAYINALLVPRDGQILVDAQCLAAQGIFHVITVDSMHDPKVGIIFDPKSLIQALADLISEYTSTHITGI